MSVSGFCGYLQLEIVFSGIVVAVEETFFLMEIYALEKTLSLEEIYLSVAIFV